MHVSAVSTNLTCWCVPADWQEESRKPLSTDQYWNVHYQQLQHCPIAQYIVRMVRNTQYTLSLSYFPSLCLSPFLVLDILTKISEFFT